MVAEKPAKILVVDDEETLTTLISDYFEYHETGIKPIITNDPYSVFPLLEEHKDIQLILSDFKMPKVNGLELLLRVKAKYPNMLFALMTGYGTQELKKVGLQRGAFRYIEKPIDLVELSEIIREELKSHVTGFGGLMESVSLPDIIQLMGITHRTATLNIIADQGKGKIIFLDGEVIHAVCGEETGEKAFYKILSWSGGRFSLAEPPLRRKRTINSSWQGLLLDAARLQDENDAGVGELLDEEGMKAIEDNLSFDKLEPGNPEILNESGLDEIDISDFELNLDSDVKYNQDNSLEELHIDLIGALHKKAFSKVRKTWPSDEKELAFNALPLSKLTVSLRRHFFFYFQMHWSRLVNKKEVPFDFKNEQIAKAMQNLLLTLRKNWIITREEYDSMIDEALRFELARFIDPIKALVLFIHKYTFGKADRIKTLLQIMMENKIIGSEYDTMIDDIELLEVSNIRIAKLEDFVWSIYDLQSEKEIFNDFENSVMHILGVMGNGVNGRLNHVFLTTMLRSRGFDILAERLQKNIDSGKEEFSIQELNRIYDAIARNGKRVKDAISQ